jgi:carbamoyl-phosphate synthase large subunit
LSEPFNILVSSAGRRVALIEILKTTLSSLGLQGQVIAIDMSRMSAAFHLADRAFLVPRCTAPEFVDEVLQICRTNHVRLIVPTIDTELSVFAANRARFEEAGVAVAVSSPEVIKVTNDKVATHRWLTGHGLPTVRQGTVAEVLEGQGGWSYPLLVKPVSGSMSKGVAVVADEAELTAATRSDTFVVQTIAPGEEYTVSFFANRSGHCECAIPRKRIEVRAGEVSKGVTVRNERIEELTFELCELLPGAYGALNVQMFFDEESSALHIIEINPRFGGGYPLAWQAGGKYPRWLIEELLDRPSTATHREWKDRMTMLRYDQAVFLTEEQLHDSPEVHRVRRGRHALS